MDTHKLTSLVNYRLRLRVGSTTVRLKPYEEKTVDASDPGMKRLIEISGRQHVDRLVIEEILPNKEIEEGENE